METKTRKKKEEKEYGRKKLDAYVNINSVIFNLGLKKKTAH